MYGHAVVTYYIYNNPISRLVYTKGSWYVDQQFALGKPWGGRGAF